MGSKVTDRDLRIHYWHNELERRGVSVSSSMQERIIEIVDSYPPIAYETRFIRRYRLNEILTPIRLTIRSFLTVISKKR